MPTIKPISDLRNYSAVLQEVAFREPVYLMENGKYCYAIVDIAEWKEYEKPKAVLRLMCELDKGRKGGEEQGWISPDDVRDISGKTEMHLSESL